MSNYLYVIGAENGPIKIGVTVNPKSRLSTIRTTSPFSVDLLWLARVEAYNRRVESTAHFILRDKRTSGEWFTVTADEAVTEIISIADALRVELYDVKRLTPLTDDGEADIQRQIAADPDDADITDEEAAQAKPFAEAFPDLMESIKRSRGRPRGEAAKQAVTLRLSSATLDRFKATGDDWRSKMSEVLEQAKV